MGLFSAPFAYRRLLSELRRTADALERIAAVLELQAGSAPRSGQSFRGFAHEKVAGDGAGSGVSYSDPAELTLAAEKEMELVALLGRRPTEVELERAMIGDVE